MHIESASTEEHKFLYVARIMNRDRILDILSQNVVCDVLLSISFSSSAADFCELALMRG